VAAREPGVDREKIQAEIDAIQEDLENTAGLAVFNGENWLSVDSSAVGYNGTKSVVSSFSRANGVVTINTIDVAVNDVKLYDDTGVVGTTTNAVTTGTFSTAAAGSFTVTSVVGAATTTHTVNYAIGDTVDTIVDRLNGLGIDGAAFAVDSSGATPQITWANRTGGTLELGAGAGLTGATAAVTTASDKAVLDKSYDYYNGTTWQSTSVATFDISALTDSAGDLATLEQYISMVDEALADVTQASADLGAVKTRIDSNSDFVSSLKDALDRGIGQLIDADMNAESTRLSALQVQQQLGIQALSIANSNSQNILSLFQ
jgi:flagellin